MCIRDRASGVRTTVSPPDHLRAVCVAMAVSRLTPMLKKALRADKAIRVQAIADKAAQAAESHDTRT
eukprot:13965657-Alexandrium_andersonii.AAC.1